MISMNERRDLVAQIDAIAHRSAHDCVIQKLRDLQKISPDAHWRIVFGDIRDMVDATTKLGNRASTRYEALALIHLIVDGQTHSNAGEAIGANPAEAMLQAVIAALVTAVHARLSLYEARHEQNLAYAGV